MEKKWKNVASQGEPEEEDEPDDDDDDGGDDDHRDTDDVNKVSAR